MVRAKFVVTSKEPNQGDEGSQVKMEAVVDGSAENEEFFNFTPFGQLTMGTVNPKAAEQFEVGKEYYLDFTPAP